MILKVADIRLFHKCGCGKHWGKLLEKLLHRWECSKTLYDGSEQVLCHIVVSARILLAAVE